MGIGTFIPQLWAAALLRQYEKSLVYGQRGVVNRDYEGEIAQQGDTVRINFVGPVAVFNYTRNSNMTAAEQIDTADVHLTITEAKAFHFQVDDIDARQARGDFVVSAMSEAAYALRDTSDQFLAAKWSDVSADNVIGTHASPISVTASNVYDYCVDLKVKLDDAKAPQEGRWMIVPPWFHGKLLKADEFVHATSLGDQVLRQGMVGRVAGFDILISHNVVNTSSAKYKIMAGVPGAITFAQQLAQVEAYRPELRFADAVKGLELYGAKVIRPSGLALLHADIGA
jgi:hypothetical protein